MRILIAEDDCKIGNYLQQGLCEAGFSVTLLADGSAALRHLLSEHCDLMILDVMLPGLDGWEILRRARACGLEIPVLFLTARDGIEDRVRGLELGADDYLVKPFAFAELLARVRTLLRRRQVPTMLPALKVANLELDTLRRRASRNGQQIELTAREFALLELMMRRRGEVLPKSLIASLIWDINFDSGTNVIEVTMRRLRAKVDDDFEPRLIHTVRGMGYRLDTSQ